VTPRTRLALRLLLFAVAALLLVRFARSVDWRETWAALRGASPALLLLATLCNLTSLLVRGSRWALFLRGAGVRDTPLALRGAVVGSGLNNVLPASGGDAARVLLVARESGMARSRIAATVALDRVVDALVYLGLLAIAPHVVPLPGMLERWGRIAGIAFAVTIAVALPLLVRADRRRKRGVSAPEALPDGAPLRARMQSTLAHFIHALAEIVGAKRLVPALALSLASWALQLATYHYTARAAGLDASPVASGAAMLAVNVAFTFPVTPGNVGVFQVIYALVMGAFGLPGGRAIAVALMIQAVQVLPVTALALGLAPGWARRRVD
jgi:uncharacterized protein (TIRG00374 family)